MQFVIFYHKLFIHFFDKKIDAQVFLINCTPQFNNKLFLFLSASNIYSKTRNMKFNNIHFWYNADHTKLHIDPVKPRMKLPMFDEKIVEVLLAIPNDVDGIPESTVYDNLYGKSAPPIETTMFKGLIGMPFIKFLAMPLEEPERNLYEYQFILESGKKVTNLLDGLMFENVSTEIINLTISKLIGTSIDINGWQPNRFYLIADGIIQPTQHTTEDTFGYICGQFMPELL